MAASADARATRRTPAARRAEAETKLLDEAARLIATTGVQKMTLALVGEGAGFSRGLVNHHFGTKLALIEHVAQRAEQAFSDAAAREMGGLDPGDSVAAIVDFYVRELPRMDNYRRAYLALWAESVAASPELRPFLEPTDRHFRAALRRIIERGKASGQVRADLDAQAFALTLAVQLRGLALQVLMEPESVDVEAVRATLVGGILRALRPL